MSTATNVAAAFKELSTGFLVDSAAFTKLTPSQQTQVLAANNGKQVVFTTSFASLRNRKNLRDGLLSGKDMATELEFNGIELTEEDRRALVLFAGLLTKIDAANPVSYPWVDELSGTQKGRINFNNPTRIYRDDHYIGRATLLAIWRKASAFWVNGSNAPRRYEVNASGSSYRRVDYYPEYVKIGCQTVDRAELEYVARELGWEPVVHA